MRHERSVKRRTTSEEQQAQRARARFKRRLLLLCQSQHLLLEAVVADRGIAAQRVEVLEADMTANEVRARGGGGGEAT